MKRPTKQWSCSPDGSRWRTPAALQYLRESLAKAQAWATAKRTCDFTDTIEIEHNDGTSMTFTYARMYQRPGPCFVVLTEHHGVFVYLKEDARVRRLK